MLVSYLPIVLNIIFVHLYAADARYSFLPMDIDIPWRSCTGYSLCGNPDFPCAH